MSQTIDTSQSIIPESLTGRDKLFKLAEVNDSKVKKSSKFSFTSRNSNKSMNHDLSFTTNIEHLVNKSSSVRSSTPTQSNEHLQPNSSISHDVNSNVSCESVCKCSSHSTSKNDTGVNSTLEELNFSDLKISEANSIHSNIETKSRIPQSVNRRRLTKGNAQCQNKWLQDDILYNKQSNGHSSLSKLPETDITPKQNLSMSSNTTNLIKDNTCNLTSNQSRIPTFHKSAFSKLPLFDNINHYSSNTNNSLYNSKEKPLLRTNSFISYLSNNNRKYSSLGLQTKNSASFQTHSPKINEIQSQKSKINKSLSHNALLHRNLTISTEEKDSSVPFLDLTFANDSKNYTTAINESDKFSNQHSNQSNSKMMNRFDSFFVMEEDTFANSPKRILYQNPFSSNCQKGIKPMLISTPNQQVFETRFLQESQKNTLLTINSNTEVLNCKAIDKSNSCDSLKYFRSESFSKPKSETDLTCTEQSNDLARLMHLEENINEENSMFNRFRKTFSLRFSKPWSSVDKTTQEPFLNLPFDYNFKIPEEPLKIDSNNVTSDINQNRIYRNNYSEFDSMVDKISTIERRKSRAEMIHRKSFQRKSRKSLRLKRSHSQPTDKSPDQISPNTDLSIDSEFEGIKDSTSQGDIKSRNQLNDSSESNDETIFAEAIWDYSKNDNEELSFRVGDLIDVTDTSHKEWWWGAIKTKDEITYGWFPSSYVRLKVSQEETLEEALNANEDSEASSKKRMSVSRISAEQVRANVVLEIINTERDFVKNLTDVIDGYLKPCRDRSDMFDEARLSTIFGNIEALYSFQTKFLCELERAIDWENLSSSQIGHCFLTREKDFSVYCDFCKNHPLASSELQELYSQHRYIVFFEGCRLLQNMIDISLDGFLLTPIQKICKYPLQLSELLKYTRNDHPDYQPVMNAYMCMQRVAQLVNERKRRFESLEQLIALQESFENWEGPMLLDTCSLLIHSGEVTRITSSSWSKDITLFLFDHLLVLCKKDTGILKKSTYIFKSRIDLDHIDSVVSLEDNIRDAHFNVITKNAFKLFYKHKQKWYLFQAKSAKDKQKWMQSFEEERIRVIEDQEQNFSVSDQDKKGAFLAHQYRLKPKKPRVRRPYVKAAKKPDTVIAEIPLGPLNGFEMDRNRAGSLPSYICQEKQALNNLYKQRQSTMHKKNRSNWFQLGSSHKNRLKRNLK